jgi:hypothetical protein
MLRVARDVEAGTMASERTEDSGKESAMNGLFPRLIPLVPIRLLGMVFQVEKVRP